MNIRLSFSWTLFLTAALASGASAQLTGSVRDLSGAPLGGATVEAWGESGRIAHRISGPDGQFRFDRSVSEVTTRVIVDLIGYQTQVVQTTAPNPPVTVTLEVRPVPLPELIVTATQARCPAPDESRARDVWRAAAARYSDETIKMAGTAVVYEAAGEVTEDAVGNVEEVAVQPVGRVWGGAQWPPPALGRYNIDEGSKRDGYVSKARDGQWVYPNLAGVDASHFASSAFGDLHNFVVVTETPEAVVLQFCPNREKEGTITGTLHVAHTGQVLEARWTFDSADRTEEAGGEAFFGEFVEPESGARHLVPGRGAFWRQVSGDRQDDGPAEFWQLLQVFNNVQLAEDKHRPRQ